MNSFRQTVAVVTGAASGIGRGLCEVLADEGARIVAADVEGARLDATVQQLRGQGATAIGHVTDVAEAASVQALADRAFGEFGRVDVLCNNAGVFLGGLMWETTDTDWDWILGVNLRGLVNGIRAFVPRMIAQDSDGHVINTASLNGMVSSPFSGPYCTSKFAAVGLTECLAHDLASIGSRIRASVVVPGAVDTAIASSDRNRPAHLTAPAAPSAGPVAQSLAALTASGKNPRDAARRIVDGVKAGWFYLPTNDSYPAYVGAVNDARLAKRLAPFQMFD
jgi:NAD(P)-dependent dehydrogenase (short-subunit alcohol dehydrogenase family)